MKKQIIWLAVGLSIVSLCSWSSYEMGKEDAIRGSAIGFWHYSRGYEAGRREATNALTFADGVKWGLKSHLIHTGLDEAVMMASNACVVWDKKFGGPW